MIVDFEPYYPEHYRNFAEWKSIIDGLNYSFNNLWDCIEKVRNNHYIMTLDDYGCSRWESILGELKKDTDTLEQRRLRILGRLNEKIPYTRNQLVYILNAMLGVNNFTIYIDYANYYIDIGIKLVSKDFYDAVKELLRKVISCNMEYNCHILYNTHEVLGKYTHGELGNFTHEQLQSEDLEATTNILKTVAVRPE